MTNVPTTDKLLPIAHIREGLETAPCASAYSAEFPCKGSRLVRFEAHSQPGCDVCCEDHAWQEVGGKLVVAVGHALEVLQAAEGVFDEVAVAIARFIVADEALAILATRNEWFGTCLS